MSSLSSAQFNAAGSLGIDTDVSAPTPHATPLSAQSMTSAGRATSWTTSSLGSGPQPYSKKTRGSYVSWDDDNSGPTLPQSDRGASFLGR